MHSAVELSIVTRNYNPDKGVERWKSEIVLESDVRVEDKRAGEWGSRDEAQIKKCIGTRDDKQHGHFPTIANHRLGRELCWLSESERILISYFRSRRSHSPKFSLSWFFSSRVL